MGPGANSRVAVLVISLILALSPAAAQEPERKPACDEPEHRAFDFWLGEWDVLNPQGHQAGVNRIEKILNGCALLENWTGSRGGAGKSLNFFNAATRRWEQVWVADGGGVIKYEGEFKDGAMRFAGEFFQRDAARLPSRMTLTPLDGGRVRQLIERSTDGGMTWTVWFDGTYVRRAKAPSP
ncbi:MAG: hypothetical protein ACRD4U_09090 [Candidatus Acidiferrales bacterium]